MDVLASDHTLMIQKRLSELKRNSRGVSVEKKNTHCQVFVGVCCGELIFAYPCFIPVRAGVPTSLAVHPDLPTNTITYSVKLNYYHNFFFYMLLQVEPFNIHTQIYISGFGCFLATVTDSNVFLLAMAFDQKAVKTRLRDHTSSHLFGKVYLRDRSIFIEGVTLTA